MFSIDLKEGMLEKGLIVLWTLYRTYIKGSNNMRNMCGVKFEGSALISYLFVLVMDNNKYSMVKTSK